MKILTTKSAWFRDSDLRLDASFHLSEGQITAKKIANAPVPLTTLEKETSSIFSGNIFKRAYVNSPEFGYGYLTGSDMMKSDINSGKFISKKYTKQVDKLRIGKHWILVSCSGTLGNVVFTNDDFTDKIGTHDLIRIIPSEDGIKAGYLYAYLASKYGYSLLVQSSYGGVIQHIEPHHIKDLPIPLLPEKQQEEIHQLIVDAAQLRVEANRLLGEAHFEIEKAINFQEAPNFKKSVKFSSLNQSYTTRFEANYYLSKGFLIKNHIEMGKYLSLKELALPIFRPGIFKRHYVEKGIEFFGGADITKTIPTSDKKLSAAKSSNLDGLLIREDWILVTCGGTIGHTLLVDKHLDGKAASQHILRIRPNKILAGYLYAFLSSKLGKDAIQSFTYGSVIPQIEPHHLEKLPIPILDEAKMKYIDNLVMEYKNKSFQAKQNELNAIQLIENEISTWQV